jgi:type I restriction enzyme S subunit
MASVNTQGHVVSGVVQRELGSGTKFVNGDTLLARITPCLENGKSAYVDFLPDEQVGWGSTEFVVLRPRQPLPTYHGYLLVRHPPFRDHAIQSMSGTSGRQRVQNDVLGRFPVAVPTADVAAAFGEPITALQKKIASNHEQARTLASLRDTLLPRLVSGQLRVEHSEAT